MYPLRWSRFVVAAALVVSGSLAFNAAGPTTIDIPVIPGQAQAWSNPTGIAIDTTTGRAFVVTYTDPGRLFVIDTTTLQILTDVVVDPTPVTVVALNTATRRIYAPTSSELVVLDEDTLAPVAAIPFNSPGPGGIAVDPATNTFYLSQTDGTVTRFNGVTNTAMGPPVPVFPGCSQGFPGIDFDAATHRVVMSSYCSSAVRVLDAATLNPFATIPTVNPQNVAIDHATANVYASNIENQTVTVINGSTFTVDTVVPVGQRPSTVFVDQAANRVYVGNTFATTISVLDASSHAVVDTLDIGGPPAMFALDPLARIWVTNSTGCTNQGCTGGRVSILSGDVMPPTSTHQFGTPPNANGWNKFNVFISLSAQDNPGGSGVQSISYSLSGAQTGGSTVSGSFASFNILNQGTTTVTYHATDMAGNVEADHTLLVRYDGTQPTIDPLLNITVNATSAAGAVVTFSPTASDPLSGVDTIVVSPKPSGSVFPHGMTMETVTVTDKAGNIATRNFSVIVNKSLVSIAVQPPSATIGVGQGQFFQAIGTFTDGSTQTLPGGGSGGGGTTSGSSTWNIHFDSFLNVSACTGNAAGFSSQGIGGTSTLPATVDTIWGNPPAVHATGTITASQVTLTLACINTPATGSLTASWTGTRFAGTATLSGSTDPVTIRGWSTKASMPSPGFAIGAATVNDVIYAMGIGNPSQPSPVQAYNIGNDTWSAVTTMPTSREGGSYAALNGRIYAAGGHVAGGAPTAAVDVYDPVSNTWNSLASMTTPRAEFQLVAASGRLYAIGGELGSQTPGMASVERIDPDHDAAWTPVASMAAGRKFHAAGALNSGSLIVVAGGNDSGPSTTELYDVAANTWSAGPTPPFGVNAAGAAVVNNALFVVGGGSNGGTTVQMFRPANGNSAAGWALPGDMPTGRGQLAVAAASTGDVLYAFGGLHDNVALNTVEAMSTPPPTDLQVGSGTGGGSSLSVQWASTNPTAASINGSGLASGSAAGQATIIASAGGVSCLSAGGTCAALTVQSPPTECAQINVTITPVGSLPFSALQASIDGKPGTFDLPLGTNHFTSAERSYTVHFFPPSGYSATPNPLTFTATCSAPTNVEVIVAALDTTPPVLTLPANITTPATSPSGAVVSFTATAIDAVDGPRPVSCTPASGSLFPAGVTTTVNCSTSDTHGNSATGSFTVHVLSAAEIVSRLIPDSASFAAGQNLLTNVLRNINAGSASDACSQLGAFINQVQVQAGKKVTDADAARWIRTALQAKAALGCA